MSRSWVVFGAGGHARAVIDVIHRRLDAVHAVVDVRSAGAGLGEELGWQTWESDEEAMDHVVAQGLPVVVGIGAPGPRVRVIEALVERGWDGPALVAATATVAPGSPLGAGTVVMEHAHVGPGSVLGTSVIVNTGAVVEHDCHVGDGVHLAPGSYLLGAASVGERSFIGSGARVLPGVSIGDDCTVGAGAVVLDDIPAGSTVVGVPARLVSHKEPSR